MSSRNGPDVPKLMLTVISRSVNLPWTASGFVCSMSISLSFPAPSSSIDLNSNNDKTYKVTPMIKLSRNASIEQRKKPSWFATISEFLGVEARYTKYSRKGQCKEKWNHFWDNRFSVLNPPCFSSPGRPFFCTDDRKPKLKLGVSCVSCFGKTWSKLDQQRVISIIAKIDGKIITSLICIQWKFT